jgi:hypothetical protein
MKQITRAATLSDSDDLLARVPHANLAFATSSGIDAMPVGFRYAEGRYWVGFPLAGGPAAGTHAMLVIDDGWYYFELRGVRVRGMLRDAPPPPSVSTALRWLELEPIKINAWNYGSLRARAEP